MCCGQVDHRLASREKASSLPSKPLRTTSAMVGKGYSVAGQAGTCLQTMAVLQAYQADLLKELELHQLNPTVIRLKFSRMLTLKKVMFVTIDQKDSHYHLSILPTHRKFLKFTFGGKAYQYRVLPFGIALSPHTFTKCVDAALAPLRLHGICIPNYIDDWLNLAQLE